MDLLDQERRGSTITTLRVAFVTLAMAAGILGFVGFTALFAAEPDGTATSLDAFYYTLQLFVLDADQLSDRADLPWQLQVARFAAPTATVFALVETARVLLTGELHRLRARRARRHVVVCGDSAFAHSLAVRLHAAGRRVIIVGPSSGVAPTSLRQRLYLVSGDPTNAEVLRAAGAGRADLVYACTDDSTDNVLAATTAGLLRDERNRGMRIYAQIHDPELCLALQARRLSQPAGTNLRLDFFNMDELAARWLFRQDPLPYERLNRVLILGMSMFGQAVLVEVARHWRLQHRAASRRLRVDLVAAGGEFQVGELFHRYPFLTDVCDVRYGAEPLDQPSDVVGRRGYDRVFVCYDDEEHGLKVALTTPSLWRGGAGSVIVPVVRLSGLAGAFTDNHGRPGLLDAISGTVRCYPMVDAASDPDRIGDDLLERLGQSIHDRYVLTNHDASTGQSDNPAWLPWSALPEDLRGTNRAHAEDIGRKLRTLGLAVAPRIRAHTAVRLTDGQIEQLARLEHERWFTEWTTAGWRFGDRRDRSARTHPDLRPWSGLTDAAQEKCRQEIRQIPEVLADVGLEIVRVGTGGPAGVPRRRADRGERSS